MNKKSKIIILSIIILLIVSSLLYVSYGYVMTKVEGNTTVKKFASLSQVLKIEYSDGTETLNSGDYFIPGSVLTKTFTIKNTGNVNLIFSVNLNNVSNNFTRFEDLVYELYLGDELLVKNTFPEKDDVIAYSQNINVNETLNYTLKIIYNKSEENQIVDQGKIIRAEIDFEQQENSFSNLQILGNSVQESENLFVIKSDSTYTGRGITNTAVTGDSHFILNGTATADTSAKVTESLGLFKKGTYSVSVFGLNTISDYLDRIFIQNVSDNTVIVNNITVNSPKTFILEEDTELRAQYVIANGSTYNNKKIQVNISKQPTPETPVEIESVGEKTKNLINSILESKLGFEGTATAGYTLVESNYNISNIIEVTPNSTLYLSGDLSDFNSSVFRFGFSKEYPKAGDILTNCGFIQTNNTIKVPDDSYYMVWSTQYQVYNQLAKKVQLEVGATATEYEPYGKYKIPVKISGKNLFDYNDLIREESYTTQGVTYTKTKNGILVNGSTADGAWAALDPVNVKDLLEVGKTYTVSPGGSGVTGIGNVSVIFDAITNGKHDYSKTKTITGNEEIIRIYLQVAPNLIVDNVLIQLQLEENSIPTDYEPYVEPKITNIYLDEPLRKVGTCTDNSCMDYIDLKTRTITRNVREVVLNGTEAWNLQSINSYGIANFYIQNLGAFKNSANFISNRLLLQTTVIANTKTEGMFYANASSFFIRLKSEIASNVTLLNEWLKNNNIKVHYLVEPQTKLIELPYLYSIPTNANISISTSVQPTVVAN